MQGGGAEFVYSSGSAISTMLSSGGYLIVLPNGEQTGTVRSGGTIVSTGVVLDQPESGLTVYPGVASGSGAIEYALPGGTTSNTTVSGSSYEGRRPRAPGRGEAVELAIGQHGLTMPQSRAAAKTICPRVTPDNGLDMRARLAHRY